MFPHTVETSKGPVTFVQVGEPIVGVPVLTPKWCDCKDENGEFVDTGFLCYPEDGKCECGMYKHHVHGQCGHVTQVG